MIYFLQEWIRLQEGEPMSISLFDIIGPRMIGPSSSHTAGAVRIGQVANRLVNGRSRLPG